MAKEAALPRAWAVREEHVDWVPRNRSDALTRDNPWCQMPARDISIENELREKSASSRLLYILIRRAVQREAYDAHDFPRTDGLFLHCEVSRQTMCLSWSRVRTR